MNLHRAVNGASLMILLHWENMVTKHLSHSYRGIHEQQSDPLQNSFQNTSKWEQHCKIIQDII